MSSAAVNRVEVTVKISNAVATDVTEATVKQVLGISPSGSATKYLNEQGNFTTPAGGGGSVAWGAITGSLSSQTDLQTALNGKQNTLGFTPENVSNKSTNVATDQASNTKYPSVKAVYDWVLSLGYITSAALTGYATQAYVNAQGFITNVVTALGYTPENVANKKTTLADDSDTFYPSQKAVKTAVDAKQNALNGTGFVRQDGAVTTYDTLSRLRTFSQSTAEVSLTASTAETIVDTITISANTIAANDLLEVYLRFLKTTTANATVRIYTNTATNLTGAVLLGSYTIAAANRYASIKRTVACKASGVLEVISASTATIITDIAISTAAETTTTISYSGVNYLIVTMQLVNSTDTIRRSFIQVQHQRQAS
jgi:hypothetical protein